MSLDYTHAAMHAMHENGLCPIEGRYPVELSIEQSIGVALVYATLAVSERLDAIMGHLEEGAIGVRDVDRV